MGKSTSTLVSAVLFLSIGAQSPLTKHAATKQANQAPVTQPLPAALQPTAERNTFAALTPQNNAILLPSRPKTDCHQQACVALTFDDGPNPITTPIVLNALEQADATATFFMVGSRVPANADLVKQMYAAGMEIGNHSWSHPNFAKLPPDQMRQQVDQTQAVITSLGIPAPQYFRPPYEGINPTVTSTVQMPFILWNVDPKDWSETDPNKLIATIDAQVKPGSIIILHDIWHSTANSLPPILAHLKTKYQLVSVGELLDLPPNAQGVYSHQ